MILFQLCMIANGLFEIIYIFITRVEKHSIDTSKRIIFSSSLPAQLSGDQASRVSESAPYYFQMKIIKNASRKSFRY